MQHSEKLFFRVEGWERRVVISCVVTVGWTVDLNMFLSGKMETVDLGEGILYSFLCDFPRNF